MRILIYGINFSPELTGIGKYSGEMATHFAEQGHEVEVITAPPYYPKWSISSEYSNFWKKEDIKGIRVLRCPVYIPKEPTGIKRVLHEFSFVLSSLRYWIPRYFRRYDVILCVSPPFHLPYLALPHLWFRNTKVVNHIQDLQVDAASNLGMLSPGLIRLLFAGERWILGQVTAISTISDGMLNKLRGKLKGPKPILMFPNWVDHRVIYPVAREKTMREEWGIGQREKLILYSGNLGEKQGLETIVEIARSLEDHDTIHFIIIGEGGSKPKLVELAESYRLKNLRFLPLQPYAKLSRVLASADVHLVLQKKAAADLVMPSKLTNILAVGGHAVVTADPGTTLHDVVVANKLGTVVPAEDEAALRQGILDITQGRRSNDAAGSVAYARENLHAATILNRFLEEISEL